MVAVMPAVMAAEQIGGGREELEDFDEAADGEPALVEGDSSAVAGDRHHFFGGWTWGEAHAAPLAAPSGVRAPPARSRSRPRHPAAAWR